MTLADGRPMAAGAPETASCGLRSPSPFQLGEGRPIPAEGNAPLSPTVEAPSAGSPFWREVAVVLALGAGLYAGVVLAFCC